MGIYRNLKSHSNRDHHEFPCDVCEEESKWEEIQFIENPFEYQAGETIIKLKGV